MVKHELKTDPKVFQASWDNKKHFEIRKNDRNYKIGDSLYLRETKFSGEEMHEYGSPLEYTGRVLHVNVSYVLEGPCYGLKDGWCILSTGDTD